MISPFYLFRKSNHQKITILCNFSIHRGGIGINQIYIHMLTIDTHLLVVQNFEILFSLNNKWEFLFSSDTEVKLFVWLCCWVSSGSNVFYKHSRRLTRCHTQLKCCSLVIRKKNFFCRLVSPRGCRWLHWPKKNEKKMFDLIWLAHGNWYSFLILQFDDMYIRVCVCVCIFLNPNRLFQYNLLFDYLNNEQTRYVNFNLTIENEIKSTRLYWKANKLTTIKQRLKLIMMHQTDS